MCKACQSVSNQRSQRECEPLTGTHCRLCDTPLRGRSIRIYCGAKCKDRANALKARFGLTVEQYRELVADTGGRCPICAEETTFWHVDHEHSTGKVTGVVCSSCNVGALARTYHNPRFIRRLLDYVEHTPAEALGIEAVALTTRPSTLHDMWVR